MSLQDLLLVSTSIGSRGQQHSCLLSLVKALLVRKPLTCFSRIELNSESQLAPDATLQQTLPFDPSDLENQNS